MATESQIALYENFKAINTIETASYDQFDVKRGLRNADGTASSQVLRTSPTFTATWSQTARR